MMLKTVWDRLAAVRDLTFSASSSTDTGWTGSGIGTVDVFQPSSDVLVYKESGTWTPSGGKQLSFTNVYRWKLLDETLQLEHLRFGEDKPVYLFDLAMVDDFQLASVEPHI